MTKEKIIYATILILCMIILIIGVIFDNHCETFIGILGIVSGWIALAMCSYFILQIISSK